MRNEPYRWLCELEREGKSVSRTRTLGSVIYPYTRTKRNQAGLWNRIDSFRPLFGARNLPFLQCAAALIQYSANDPIFLKRNSAT